MGEMVGARGMNIIFELGGVVVRWEPELAWLGPVRRVVVRPARHWFQAPGQAGEAAAGAAGC